MIHSVPYLSTYTAVYCCIDSCSGSQADVLHPEPGYGPHPSDPVRKDGWEKGKEAAAGYMLSTS